MGVVNFCYIYCRKDYSKGLTNHKVMHDRLGNQSVIFLSKYYPKTALIQTKKDLPAFTLADLLYWIAKAVLKFFLLIIIYSTHNH